MKRKCTGFLNPSFGQVLPPGKGGRTLSSQPSPSSGLPSGAGLRGWGWWAQSSAGTPAINPHRTTLKVYDVLVNLHAVVVTVIIIIEVCGIPVSLLIAIVGSCAPTSFFCILAQVESPVPLKPFENLEGGSALLKGPVLS